MAVRNPIALILCTGNSCRSQMAEGFLRRYQGERLEVHSAGTDSKREVHPRAVRVMAEVGIDINGHRPKPLSRFLGPGAVRQLITVCDHAFKTCPRAWPGSFTRDYLLFEDPAEFAGSPQAEIEKFRRVRDDIGVAMRAWSPQPERAFA